jgi:predicted secreted Zn-dependent protease
VRAAIRVASLALVAGTLHAEPPTPKGLEVVDRTLHYLVTGSTARALNAQVRALGPLSTTGRRVWGLTHWEVRARYNAVPLTDGCRIEHPRARIEVTTTLPEWRSTGGADRHLRKQWRALLNHLIAHEQTHRDHGLQAATRAAAELRELPVLPDCGALAREVQSILRRVVGDSRRLSLAYDRETDFGALEGVRLEEPPDARGHLR